MKKERKKKEKSIRVFGPFVFLFRDLFQNGVHLYNFCNIQYTPTTEKKKEGIKPINALCSNFSRPGMFSRRQTKVNERLESVPSPTLVYIIFLHCYGYFQSLEKK